METLDLTRSEGIVTVTLNRPEKKNALQPNDVPGTARRVHGNRRKPQRSGLNQSFEMSMTEALEAEATAQALALGSLDFTDAVMAFREKRSPRFDGR